MGSHRENVTQNSTKMDDVMETEEHVQEGSVTAVAEPSNSQSPISAEAEEILRLKARIVELEAALAALASNSSSSPNTSTLSLPLPPLSTNKTLSHVSFF